MIVLYSYILQPKQSNASGESIKCNYVNSDIGKTSPTTMFPIKESKLCIVQQHILLISSCSDSLN